MSAETIVRPDSKFLPSGNFSKTGVSLTYMDNEGGIVALHWMLPGCPPTRQQIAKRLQWPVRAVRCVAILPRTTGNSHRPQAWYINRIDQ